MRDTRKKSKRLDLEPGAGEPLMLVASLAIAISVAFLLYGDRMRSTAKDERTAPAMRTSSLSLSMPDRQLGMRLW